MTPQSDLPWACFQPPPRDDTLVLLLNGVSPTLGTSNTKTGLPFSLVKPGGVSLWLRTTSPVSCPFLPSPTLVLRGNDNISEIARELSYLSVRCVCQILDLGRVLDFNNACCFQTHRSEAILSLVNGWPRILEPACIPPEQV